MTPKEKAEELVMKFSNPFAKSCALIAVDEILNDDWYITTYQDLISRKTYW